MTDKPRVEPPAFEQDVERWARELREGGWRELRRNLWRAPITGILYRGPYKA